MFSVEYVRVRASISTTGSGGCPQTTLTFETMVTSVVSGAAQEYPRYNRSLQDERWYKMYGMVAQTRSGTRNGVDGGDTKNAQDTSAARNLPPTARGWYYCCMILFNRTRYNHRVNPQKVSYEYIFKGIVIYRVGGMISHYK